MKIRILGCGASFGSPLAWQHNGKIDINNKRNFRTRSSILITINNNTNILIDTSPDLRQQLYKARCTCIAAVLYTHIHSDHTSGLPDMRAISLINDTIIPAFMPLKMKEEIQQKMQDMQVFEQNIQSLLIQKQNLQVQLSEIDAALNELNIAKTAYKMVGGIMVLSKKEDLIDSLIQKKKIFELRLKKVEEQEKGLQEKTNKLQSVILSKMGNKNVKK